MTNIDHRHLKHRRQYALRYLTRVPDFFFKRVIRKFLLETKQKIFLNKKICKKFVL